MGAHCLLPPILPMTDNEKHLDFFFPLRWVGRSIQWKLASVSPCFSSCLPGNRCFLLFCFFGPHPQHIEVLRVWVASELQLPAYTTATATWDPSCICDLHHSPWQCWILNAMSEARDRTCNIMVPSWICFHFTMTGIP